ncbi:MAG: RNA ligase (ATP) [Emticicia sp.]|uniref:RNA ligase (ATP) n=1 Tax=Emticicia sp. TaxID=1930953 RepID=UPI003BA82DCC
MRKLASIQKIIALQPIEGADAIEKATVLGWELVVKKGEFKVGELCIYCEIDSVLPEKPEFEFLRPRNFRVRTIRLRGQISQGICFPISFLPTDFEIIEGNDCTDILEIIKYEAPIPASLAGLMKGGFPSFIPKTDETRVQVLQDLLNKYQGEKCYISEKLDGASATFYWKNGEFGVCSRNIELVEDPENTFWKVAIELDLKGKLALMNRNIALQGELVGEGIQSNKLKIKGQTVFFFNAFDIETFSYLSFLDFKQLIEKLNLKTVPILEENYMLENNISNLVEKAKIRSSINNETWAEGIVIRPYEEINDKSFSRDLSGNGRISFKAINPEFLLKYGE